MKYFHLFCWWFFFVVAAVVVIAIPLISDSDKEHIVSYSCFPFYTPYLVLRTYCVLFQVSVSEVCVETVPYRLWDITVMASQFFFSPNFNSVFAVLLQLSGVGIIPVL